MKPTPLPAGHLPLRALCKTHRTKVADGFARLIEHLENRSLLSAGDLDSTFGSAGKVIGPAGSAADVVVQSDSKIIAAEGTTLVRYNANGSLDTTFDSDGIATSP